MNKPLSREATGDEGREKAGPGQRALHDTLEIPTLSSDKGKPQIYLHNRGLWQNGCEEQEWREVQ